MAGLCIPPAITEKIKAALVDGTLSLPALKAMKSSEERRAAWGKFLSPELAEFTTLKFEKAAASPKADALTNFLKSVTTAKDKKSGKEKTLLDRIGKIADADLLNPEKQTETFTDLFSDALGIKVSAEQMKNLVEYANKIKELKQAVAEVEFSEEKDAAKWIEALGKASSPYFTAIDELDAYINSQTPTSNWKNIFGGIFRSSMLTSPASAVTNQLSNFDQLAMQYIERRLSSGQFKGASAEVVGAWLGAVKDVYQASGHGMSRNYSAHTKLGEWIDHAEGPGPIRWVNRKMSRIVYHYMLGFADEISAAFSRIDSTVAQVLKITGQKELTGKALEIFKDSLRLEPMTLDGAIVKAESIADAEKATWTNKTWASKVSLKFRDWLNNATGDFQLGYWTNPFVKTQANVLQFGIDSSVFGFGQPLYKLKSALAARKDMTLTDAQRAKPLQDVIRLAIRAGMGTTLSLALAALIPPDDFIGAYEQLTQKQRDMMGIKKGVYNAVKIGGHWISLDYFGALGSGFVGMMYARKYGKNLPDMAYQYARGAGAQALNVPGIANFLELYTSLTDALKKDTEAGLKGLSIDGFNTVSGRVIPGILSTVAKATDTSERQMNKKNWLDRTKAGLPGLRQTLPAKVNQLTGQKIQSEGFVSNMLFGSRVKTANESRLIDEISRLDKLGFAPAIGDIERSSERVKGLKAQLSPAAYQNALKYYGQQYGKSASRLIATSEYKRAAADDKQDMLNKVRDDAREDMLDRFHYRKPKNKGLRVR